MSATSRGLVAKTQHAASGTVCFHPTSGGFRTLAMRAASLGHQYKGVVAKTTAFAASGAARLRTQAMRAASFRRYSRGLVAKTHIRRLRNGAFSLLIPYTAAASDTLRTLCTNFASTS